MEGLARIIWVSIPAVATRLSRPLGALLADGQYLAANANLAVIVPAAALVAGLLSGLLHPDAVFTASILLTLLMFLFAGVGSGVGMYILLGYVIGDLPHLVGGLVQGTQGGHIAIAEVGPLGHLYSYLVLATLVMVVPAGAKSLRDSTASVIPGGHSLAIQILLGAALLAGVAFLWRLALPIVVRPVYTISGPYPTVESVSTIQRDTGLLLVLEAAVLGALRGFLDTSARGKDGYRVAAAEFATKSLKPSLSDTVPGVVRVAGRSLLTVLLLLGLIKSLIEAGVALICVIAIMFTGSFVLPRLGGYTALLSKIPVIARVIAALVMSAAAGYIIITPFYGRMQSLFPTLISALVAIAVMIVAVPEGAIPLMQVSPNQKAQL